MTTHTHRAPPPIGGFFESHRDQGGARGPSVLDAWTDGRPYAAFVSARAAFMALAALHPQATIWLPAFVCADLAIGELLPRTRFYPVRDGFAADLAPVDAGAAPGDVVVLVAYFGWPPGGPCRAFAERRRDLVIVEDRAQALGPGLLSLGGYELYSPRKLLGVADGGILVSAHGASLPSPPGTIPDNEALWRAPDQRAADPTGADNAHWHAANQAKEAAMSAHPLAITGRSLAILRRTPLERLAAPRLANWRRLDTRLRGWSALASDPPAPPLGYVLRLDPERRRAVRDALHAERIFAAVHWPRIAAPEAAFPREAAWTRELITLPCDHRYGPGEMDRIAGCVEATLA
ncbi:MAG: hypothetical protein ACOY5Y_19950 [Pseudomonadota bacterium]